MNLINNKTYEKLFVKKKKKMSNKYLNLTLTLITTSLLFGQTANFSVTSIYSDINVRDENFNLLEKNKQGLIQVLSLLPQSYPGHSILTEDIGEIISGDDCECCYSGKRFIVHGRAPESESRGCSDT